ncbi:zinc-dependent metalloprotease [Paraglaciecola chathamensis]|uniref:Zinc-dependent metalloprotease n=1 Tax=Paraglaciecola chathamensis TaxID=368405 RepID=A0ABS0W8H2_9ALTE|nr:zinc-dependent metalloprotease [Paraglaciecola chathamensis]MBJ2135069.1 zinc-dependent metalloprotease [Paraglaciecola chathamensis]
MLVSSSRGVIFLLSALVYLVAGVANAQNISEFTAGMEQKSGFFDFYYDGENDKVYVNIDKLAQPFLFQSSMPQGIGSNDIGLDRGQLGETRLVEFQRFGNKVLLKQLNTAYRASSTNPAEQASIDEAFADSVLVGLPVVATSSDSVLVDYTDFLLSDIHQIGDRLSATKQGSYKPDASRSGVYVARSKAFVDNTELEALVTFGGTKPGEYVKQVTPAPKSISVHLHHSLIRLPDNKYQPRQFEPFSGYWALGYQDYSTPIDQSMNIQFIPRHRLSKKNPKAKVSEAVEPIVYYLDPGIPEPVLGALLDGARWWDQAFTAIGYKNAFQVKILPKGADPMDVRYSVIQWVHRATRGWSYGSSVVDPRTGEIIKGHVTLGSLRVRQDYLIALGLTSPFTGQAIDTQAQKDMALARIRQLSAHEVGHTLGIAHNFSASEYGRESVMDYPHPFITLKNGKISLEGAYAAGMGKWDNYVIAYGYQTYETAQEEAKGLKTLVTQARASGMRYQSDPDARPLHAANPSGNLWDSGADAVAELERISEVRKVALAQFGINSIPTGNTLSSLEERLVPIYLLHRYQLDAVAKVIGGVDYEYESKGDYAQPKGAKVVDSKAQSAALDSLLNTLQPSYLTLPEHIVSLIPPKAYGESRNRESFNGRTGLTFDPISAAESAANYSLTLLLQPQRLNRLASQHSMNKDAPGVSSVISALLARSLKQESDSQLVRRINYVVLDGLVNILANPTLAPEVGATIELQLRDLTKWLNSMKKRGQNQILAEQLKQYWQTGQWQSPFEAKPLPPGSPI